MPGDAFDAKIVKNVGRYVNTSNQLVLKIKEQIERKGCKWVAVEAVKHFVVEENEEKEVENREKSINFDLELGKLLKK